METKICEEMMNIVLLESSWALIAKHPGSIQDTFDNEETNLG